MARRSLVGLTVYTVLGVILLVGLGTWQVRRLAWKEGLIAEREAAAVARPAALPDTLAAARALDYRPVRATGRFLYDRELYLHATDARGAPGFHVLTPLARDGKEAVLIDRGFVPLDRKDPSSREAGNPPGEVAVTGLLRLAPEGRPGWFVPDNRPDRNEWFYVDLRAMEEAAGAGPLLPVYVDADATPNPGGFPKGGQTPLLADLPNNHLQYAITWYALAGALVVVYIVLVRRRQTGDRP